MDEEQGEVRVGRRRSLVNRLRNYLITGVIVAAPLTITVYLVTYIISVVDGVVKPWIPPAWNPETYVPFPLPGIGLVVAIVGLALLGFLAANIFGRTILALGEAILARMPLIRNVYAALKQIFETALSERSHTFRRAGLVEYPRRGLWAVVFIATDVKGEISQKLGDDDDAISVFLPTTPNPTSGFLLFVPRKDVLVLDMSVEDAAKLVISAGLITPRWAPKAQVEPMRSPPRYGPRHPHVAGESVEVPILGTLAEEDRKHAAESAARAGAERADDTETVKSE
ncbi:hypothetical protein DLJ53_15065 [Acuticoccus sediminis]|uniref:DUF502 domain-containing protein n=1 Tax=Acuticoccus sediminis TaxID=2184697 RepID=A0A8B2NZC3_9HYPH|nr:DUF502 domain-containing protein [Acuticoccus sediminis]RAI01158.1 hypothetical protein DLJ53_15065 [Acuticoccus sediminis]